MSPVFRTLQTLPGVSAAEEFSSGLAGPCGSPARRTLSTAMATATATNWCRPSMRPARAIYAVDFGGVSNLNTARLPTFARVDLRITWRPRGMQGGWELFAEIINLLNRQNAGALEAVLEYDPASDRPKIVEQRDQGIPRLPTVGFRFRF